MKNNVFILSLGLSVLALASACGGQQTQAQNSDKNADKSGFSIDDARVTKAVTDISKDGNKIRFTIPNNARAFDNAAQGVTSAIYDSAKGKPTDCPTVSSKAVSKKVDDYSAFSGKAKITATFDDESVADEVYKAGCLIIDDA